MSVHPGLRERRRADTMAEIKSAALNQLAVAGPAGLSLRAVAREVGVSVQALYHYFDSRDALITELITDTYLDLADAVQQGVEGAGPGDGHPGHCALEAGLAYRRWAMANRSAFLLIFGTPLPNFAAPQDGPTTEAAGRFGRVFLDVIFVGWTEQEMRETRLGPQHRGLSSALEDWGTQNPLHDGSRGLFGLGPAAAALFMTAWATLHGNVMLELIGQMPWLGDQGEDMCRLGLMHFWPTVERVHDLAREQVAAGQAGS